LRLYLIRHAETDYNRRRIIQGYSEIPISALGVAQAQRLAERMRSTGIDHIYASDLKRAAMTAEVVAAATGAPVRFHAGLRERDPGALTHQSYEAAQAFFTDPAYEPPGGESLPTFERRVRRVFDELVEMEGSSSRRIAVVSHGMVCAAFLRTHLGLGDDVLRGVRWRNTSIMSLDFEGAWRLLKLADDAHLAGLESPEANGAGREGSGG